jgi:hypothetical protein
VSPPEVLRELRALRGEAETQSSWQPLELTEILAGERVQERPELLTRTDGIGLLYQGRLHAINAEPEAGKGWLALAAAAERLRAGEPVLYVDFEDTPENIVDRLLALGVEPARIDRWFSYVRPEDPLADGSLDPLLATTYRLAIFDGITEALALLGLDMASNTDVAQLYKQLARPFVRAGAAVVLIDHVVKDRESRGRYGIGAQHKLAGVDVAYRLDVARPFGRGREGLVKVTVCKDRPGSIRQYSADNDRIAMMRLTSGADGSVKVTLEPPDSAPHKWRPTHYMERVSVGIEGASEALTRRRIRDTVTGKDEHVLTALDVLISEGYVGVDTSGRYPTHHPIKPFREADEDDENEGENASGSTGSHTVPQWFPEPVKGSGSPVPPLKGTGTTDTANGTRSVVPLATPEQEALINRLENA